MTMVNSGLKGLSGKKYILVVNEYLREIVNLNISQILVSMFQTKFPADLRLEHVETQTPYITNPLKLAITIKVILI